MSLYYETAIGSKRDIQNKGDRSISQTDFRTHDTTLNLFGNIQSVSIG